MTKSLSGNLRPPFLLLLSLLLLLEVSIAQSSAASHSDANSLDPQIEACYSELEEAPDSKEGPYCFYWLARRENRWKEARHHLEILAQENPSKGWIKVVLGYTVLPTDSPRAEALFQDSLEIFKSQGDLEGELHTRDALWLTLSLEDRQHEALQQLEAAEALVQRSDDPFLNARVRILRARHLTSNSSNLTEAYDLLNDCRQLIFPDGPFALRAKWLDTTARVAFHLGKAREAARLYSELASLWAEVGNPLSEASALRNSLLALNDLLELSSDPQDRKRGIDLARRTLQKAAAAGHDDAELVALIYLGDFLRNEESAVYYRQCTQLAKKIGDLERLTRCQVSLAKRMASTDPELTGRLVDEAQASMPDSQSLIDIASARHLEMVLLWAAGSPEEAYRASLEALDAIEDLRDAQSDPGGRAGLFAGWAATYPWIIGRLLRGFEESRDPVELERAFEITERMRSRVLLDILDSADITTDETPELRERRQQRSHLLQEITRIQRGLRRRGLPANQRSRLAQELEKLEEREARLRREIDRLNPRFAQLERPSFATLDQAQAALRPHEALLSFMTAPWESVVEEFAGGSWLIAVTRERTRVYRLPGGDRLRAAVPMFNGFFESQGDAPAAASTSLYQDLLQRAVDELPPSVESLILIPDGPLHRLPFAALRPTPEAPPLVAHFQLSRVPSATLWLQWRERSPDAAPLPALVLADPDLGSQSDEPVREVAKTRIWDPMRGSDLGPLPFARREGWSLRRHLGSSTRLLIGSEATEKVIKTENLARFGLLHFAAHATPDSQSPERSTVHLAPGDPREDGWLQFREIAELHLGGRPVVLSTCHSAAGKVLRGEGVLDLARAFFQGGSHAVVASLWRLEDQATAEFFDIFYRHLSQGATLSEAHQRAQRELIETGAPAAEWAGIVVLGDGEIVPVPQPSRRTPAAGVVLISLALLAAAVGVARRHR